MQRHRWENVHITHFLTLKNHFENRPSIALNSPQHLRVFQRKHFVAYERIWKLCDLSAASIIIHEFRKWIEKYIWFEFVSIVAYFKTGREIDFVLNIWVALDLSVLHLRLCWPWLRLGKCPKHVSIHVLGYNCRRLIWEPLITNSGIPCPTT